MRVTGSILSVFIVNAMVGQALACQSSKPNLPRQLRHTPLQQLPQYKRNGLGRRRTARHVQIHLDGVVHRHGVLQQWRNAVCGHGSINALEQLLHGALVGWGLFRLHNWARLATVVAMILGIAWLVPKVSAAELGVPLLWEGLQIALRAAAAWYLAQSPAVIESFKSK